MKDFEEYTTIASTEVRKIVSGLIIVVFGLAFKEDGFKLNENWFLKLALLSFFIFILTDIFQYIYGAKKTYKGKSENEISDGVLNIFMLKITFAIIGLVLCFLNLIFI